MPAGHADALAGDDHFRTVNLAGLDRVTQVNINIIGAAYVSDIGNTGTQILLQIFNTLDSSGSDQRPAVGSLACIQNCMDMAVEQTRADIITLEIDNLCPFRNLDVADLLDDAVFCENRCFNNLAVDDIHDLAVDEYLD